MDDLHDETSDLAAHVADELASADDGGQLVPLSDARLAEALQAYQQCDAAYADAANDDLRERAAIAGFWNARNVIPALVAERERLLVVVRAVADGSWWSTPLASAERRSVAAGKPHCSVVYSSADFLPVVTQARAALASADAPAPCVHEWRQIELDSQECQLCGATRAAFPSDYHE